MNKTVEKPNVKRPAQPSKEVAVKTAKAGKARIAKGTIKYNKFLNAWQCFNAAGKMMLSIGSLDMASKAYPDYVVIGNTIGNVKGGQ